MHMICCALFYKALFNYKNMDLVTLFVHRESYLRFNHNLFKYSEETSLGTVTNIKSLI